MHDPMVVAFDVRRLITVWHVEPHGHDSGEVCKHYRRHQQPDGTWETTLLHAWRWHVHHWRIQIHPLQRLQRWALTRCSWCGGRSTKRDPVNVSHSWDGPRGRWWRGEPGLFHHDCSSVSSAHTACLCADPLLEQTSYGNCALCGRFRRYGATEPQLQRQRILAAVPQGQRDPAAWERVMALAAAEDKLRIDQERSDT